MNKEFRDVKLNVNFDEQTSKTPLQSGENISTLFGKLKNYIEDLKDVAFSGEYKDLEGVPNLMDGWQALPLSADIDNLEDGFYYVGSDSEVAVQSETAYPPCLIIQKTSYGSWRSQIKIGCVSQTVHCRTADGRIWSEWESLTSPAVLNTLTSTSTKNPLSANQGRVLKELIDSAAPKGFEKLGEMQVDITLSDKYATLTEVGTIDIDNLSQYEYIYVVFDGASSDKFYPCVGSTYGNTIVIGKIGNGVLLRGSPGYSKYFYAVGGQYNTYADVSAYGVIHYSSSSVDTGTVTGTISVYGRKFDDEVLSIIANSTDTTAEVQTVSEVEQLRADVDYIAAITGVEL